MRCLTVLADIWNGLFRIDHPHRADLALDHQGSELEYRVKPLHDYDKITSSRAYVDLALKYQGEELKEKQRGMLR